MKKDNFYNDISLFRFSIIAPIINNTHGFDSISKYLVFIASINHSFNNKEYKFSTSCIKRWYLDYLKYGIVALQSNNRKDKNTSRKLSDDAILRIINLREQFPKITGTKIYQMLCKENLISQNAVSLDTVLRFLRNNNLKASQTCNVERRAFEMEHINDCWQADTSSGPYIVINNKKVRTHLIMFIDDKSRLITGFDFFLNDNAINMQSVFKKAIQTYGKPKMLYVDNGGPYDNKQLSLICASLGIQLVHTKPYSPEAKAKIERVFRTIKDGWMRCSNWNDFNSIEDIKNSFGNYLHENYNNKVHSITKKTPNDNWHEGALSVTRLDETIIENTFLHRVIRKVRLDRTIKLGDCFYEVPYKYVSKKIEIRYFPLDLKEIYIFENEEKVAICYKVDKIANSKSKRTDNIDYSKVINDETDVIEMEGK